MSHIFGLPHHQFPFYILASNNISNYDPHMIDINLNIDGNNYVRLFHFVQGNQPRNDERIKRFTKFISELRSDECSLIKYLEEGGGIYDHYQYYEVSEDIPNGRYIKLTIPLGIISVGSEKLLREMLSIAPEFINIMVNDRSLLYLALDYGEYYIAELLLLHGADPNIRKLQNDRTSLHRAIDTNKPTIVKKLLDNGADPNITYGYFISFNYLYFALVNYEMYYNHISPDDELVLNAKEIVKIIIRSGAQLDNIMYNNDQKRLYNEIMDEMNDT